LSILIPALSSIHDSILAQALIPDFLLALKKVPYGISPFTLFLALKSFPPFIAGSNIITLFCTAFELWAAQV